MLRGVAGLNLMTEGGEDYLGLQFQVEPGRVRVHQAEYASKTCAKFGFARSDVLREDAPVDGLERRKHRAALGRPAGPHHPGEHGQRPRRHRLPGHADHALAELRVRSPQQHATILESGV